MSKRQLMLEFISALLVSLFLYAALSKLLDFHNFIRQMNNQPLPNSWTPYLVRILPVLEIIIALTLIISRTRTFGLYASLILMVLFTIYTVFVLLHFFSYIPCSCGGVISKLTWKQHLLFNLFFVALSFAGILLRSVPARSTTPIIQNSLT